MATTLRADALRNRERILEVAIAAFAEHGPETKLDAIAREAGVGIGTLYRHFPTRAALIEEAYRSELTSLIEAATELMAAEAPLVALRSWMDRFYDYMLAKVGMRDALAEVVSSGLPNPDTRLRMLAATRELLEANVVAGTIRDDVDPDDVLVSLTGTVLAAGEVRQREQASRLFDLLLNGLRFRG